MQQSFLMVLLYFTIWLHKLAEKKSIKKHITFIIFTSFITIYFSVMLSLALLMLGNWIICNLLVLILLLQMGSDSLGWRRAGWMPESLATVPQWSQSIRFFIFSESLGLLLVVVTHRYKWLIKKVLSRAKTGPTLSVTHIAYMTWGPCWCCPMYASEQQSLEISLGHFKLMIHTWYLKSLRIIWEP